MNALCRVLSLLPPDAGVIVIDGRAASGKTSLAALIAERTGGVVIHMDDFFLPPCLRTESRLAIPGGNVHSERFQEEVIPFIRSGRVLSYRRFDCDSSSYAAEKVVIDASRRPVIVEGAYSLSPSFGKYYDFSVFMDIRPEEQMRRIRIRNGEEKARIFAERWIPLEEMYISAFSIPGRADIIIDSCQESSVSIPS